VGGERGQLPGPLVDLTFQFLLLIAQIDGLPRAPAHIPIDETRREQNQSDVEDDPRSRYPARHLKIRLPLLRGRGKLVRLRETHVADDPQYFIHGAFAHVGADHVHRGRWCLFF